MVNFLITESFDWISSFVKNNEETLRYTLFGVWTGANFDIQTIIYTKPQCLVYFQGAEYPERNQGGCSGTGQRSRQGLVPGPYQGWSRGVHPRSRRRPRVPLNLKRLQCQPNRTTIRLVLIYSLFGIWPIIL